MSELSAYRCPNCGQRNRSNDRFCATCGNPLPVAATSRPTTPITVPTNPVAPVEPTAPAEPPRYVPPARTRRGPHGCVLAVLSIAIVALIACAVIYFLVMPVIQDRSTDELRNLVRDEVTQVAVIPVQTGGQVSIVESDINEWLGGSISNDFVKNPRVTINPTGIEVTFKTAGQTSTFSGNLAVVDNRIVVTNPDLSGPADQFFDTDEIAEIIEQQSNALLTRFNLVPTSVVLEAGQLIVQTEPAA